jgi:hypothetical protein
MEFFGKTNHCLPRLFVVIGTDYTPLNTVLPNAMLAINQYIKEIDQYIKENSLR